MTEFDPTKPPPTLNEFQADFQPTATDIDAIHGKRTNDEVKIDETVIRSMETDGLSKHWSSPWFECKDLSKYHIANPRVDFPRLARQYENILQVWQNNFKYGRKIQQNPQLRLPPFARLGQACNGDLEASNARRRKHLIGTIAYCWQLRTICKDEKEWLDRQANKRKIINAKKLKKKQKEKKENKKDPKNKAKTGDIKEDKEEEEEEDDDIKEVEEVNPYMWGNTTPSKMYNECAKALVGVFFLCLCGFVPIAEIQSDLYYQKKYDAAHVFANHMAKLVYLTTADNKPLFQVILNMVCTGNTGRNFVFTHHLHNCINFESKHSTQSLREQASQLDQALTDLPVTSSKRRQKLAQLHKISDELNTCATLNDQFIMIMKQKSLQNRTDRKTKKVRPYPDYVYLRVFHKLGLERDAIQLLSSWGINEEDYNKVWRKIDNGDLDNNLRRIICGAVSYQSKKQSAMDIDHHKLGIGPDYIKKKYSDLLSMYNQQRTKNQTYDDNVADLLENNTDFLNHFGNVPDTNNQDNKLNLREDEINTTMFAHKYLSGQIMIPDDDDDKEEEKQPQQDHKEEEKQEEIIITPDGKIEKEEKLDALPQNNNKLQQLLRRKERLLVSMTNQYGYSEDEIKKMLELTDGRAVALTPEEFYTFYGSQPVELIHKFMDKNLNEKDRESMSNYLKLILDSYRRVQLEKMKLKDPAKHFGSLRNAVYAHHQSAVERIDYTKKKYTDEYFQKVQGECEAFEKKLQDKKQQQRSERRQRLEAIKKLERKKRQRLTTPINDVADDMNVLNAQEAEKLKSLKESQDILTQNEQIIKQNIAIKESNEHILDQFFDSEDAKLKEMNTDEAKEERLRGVDDSGKNELGMQGFLNRESSKNYGKIVAAKTDVTPITEQVIQKRVERIRKRTSSRVISYTQEQLHTPAQSPHLSTADQSSGNLYMQSQNEKLQKLLVAVSNQATLTPEMREDAKSLLTPMNIGYRTGLKSPSPSPMTLIGDEHVHTDDSNSVEAPPKGHGHYKSNSVVVHDNVLEHEYMHDIPEESDDNDHDIVHGIIGIDEEHETHDNIVVDPFKLPFKDIEVVAQDLTWLDTDELVPISRKEMLDANEISRLKVKEVPDMEVIRSDGLEQRERQKAVDKLEKSYMADAALKKAKDREKQEMQKRLDAQKQAILEAELKREQQEFDILKQGHVIRQKKSPEEFAAELAALTPEQKEERRQKRQERNKYMASSRNPQLLEVLDRGVLEDTVMVEVEVDDFELIAIEETKMGQELIDSAAYMKELEAKYDGDDDVGDGGVVVDMRQEKIFSMNTREIYAYIVEKTGMKEEIASKVLECGLTGEMIEIAIMDDELNELFMDIGFAFVEVAGLVKCLQIDGWKLKEVYPVSMSGVNFVGWVEGFMGKGMVEVCVNHGIDGRCMGLCIEEGDGVLREMMLDAGAGMVDEKEIEVLRSKFVIDSGMVVYWNVYDVCAWVKSVLKSVKGIDMVVDILLKHGIDGRKLLSLVREVGVGSELSVLGIEQAVQSKIQGKIKRICKSILDMDCVEIMYWIHGFDMECNDVIAQTLFEYKIDGHMLMNASDLKAFLKIKLHKVKVGEVVVTQLVGMITKVVLENGGFISLHCIQDPHIMDFNPAAKGKGKKRMSPQEKITYEAVKQKEIKSAKRRHSRVQSHLELGQSYVIQNGKKFIRVYKGKKKEMLPQKIKNYTKKTITLGKARNQEQAKIRMARKQKYDKRRMAKEAIHEKVSDVISQQLEHGIMEANEMIGIRENEDDLMTDSDEDYTDSEEEMERNIIMTHRSQISTSRIVKRLEFVGDIAQVEQGNSLQLEVPGMKKTGRVTMAGHALEDFVGDHDRTLFHKRRASSIVQRIVAKSQNDLQNFRMRRGSKSRLSRRSLSKNLSSFSGGRHSRGFSSGHFVTQFFKSASDRQKIEAGMRGEAPLIVYYCDKDEEKDEIRDIYQTAVLDTYIDDYSTFDDYIKILSMRLEQAQKKHRTEMDELRRSKEDLTNEVDALRTKKEELIRLIAQERSLFKRELPALARAKKESNAAQDDYDKAEKVIRDKFNETKLHVMMMMQFRDNHLQKLDIEKLKSSNIKQQIHSKQSDIEELLSHYFTLQNAHNKLEHTVALLSELTTLCHEVNVRKKAEYEVEIQDLLAMIERYRCRIRNVDRLIQQYESEVVELRMLHETRSAEFKKIQKNPTTNRTAATIDYYVAQRKLYEEKIAKQDNTFDDFVSVTQRYTKELSAKQTALNHYTRRSALSDTKFKSSVQRKNAIYKECRAICKGLGISWKQAEKDYIERGHELAQQFNDQYATMLQFEQDSKPYGYEFIDAPTNYETLQNKKQLIASFDNIITNKTHEDLLKEEAYVSRGHLDRANDDIDSEKIELDANYKKITSDKTFNIQNNSADQTAKQMSILHRGDRIGALDTYRSPGIRNMDEHPDNSLIQTFQAVDNSYYDKYGHEPRVLVNLDNSHIEEGPSDNENDGQHRQQQSVDSYQDDHEEEEQQMASSMSINRSVHFKPSSQLEKHASKTQNIDH